MFERDSAYASLACTNSSFGGNVRQTTRAHRLTQKAYNIGGERAQCAILRRLFRAHCEQEKDIGDAHTLALIASSPTHPFSNPAKPFLLGADELINGASTEANTLVNSVGTSDADDDDAAQIFDTEEEALEWIEGHELEAEVKSMSLNAEAKGVKGVPFTVIDGRWAVSGCQKPECYYKVSFTPSLGHSFHSLACLSTHCVDLSDLVLHL